MKVTCDRGSLAESLNLAGGAVVNRTPKPVLLSIKLEADAEALTIAATDLEVALHLTVHQVQVHDPGTVLIPADKLQAIVRESVDPTITIETEDDTAHIRGEDSHFKIYGHSPEDFPPIGTFTEEPDFEINSGELASLIHKTLFATAKETSRYAINGVLIEREGKNLSLVATDGRRLALAKGTCSTSVEEATTAIIPTKALNLLVRLLDDPSESVKVKIEGNQIMFGAESATLTSNLVEGNFPPYRDVIPKDQDRKGTFTTEVLSSGVRRAALLTNEESKGVKFAFEGDKLVLSSRAPEMGEAEVSVPAESYHGESIEIGFNPHFIIDGLKAADEQQVTLEFKAPNKPGLLRGSDGFLYVIMPVSLG